MTVIERDGEIVAVLLMRALACWGTGLGRYLLELAAGFESIYLFVTLPPMR